ncbi:MAG: hypothetical protein ACRBN8_05765 [Nannocystales bacterium]
MANERATSLQWLPATFVLEVVAWEVGSRLDLAMLDPSWEELGRSIDVERITWGLGCAATVLFVLFMVLPTRWSKGGVSCVQLLGVLGLGAYWIGASVVASGAVVVVASVAAFLLSGRTDA